MYLTEEEAKKEDCPFKNKWCDLCCMAWRWAGWVNAANHTDGREPRPQPMEKDLILAANVESEIVRVGYCGACGGPE